MVHLVSRIRKALFPLPNRVVRARPTAAALFSVLFTLPAFSQQGEPGRENALNSEFSEPDILQFETEVEIEFIRERNFDAVEKSELALTVSSGAELQLNDWVSATGILELNSDVEETEIIVDEAFVEIDNEYASPFAVKGGYFTSPFGNFKDLHIAKPLTEAVFEVTGEVVELRYGSQNLTANVFAFRGRKDLVLYQSDPETPENQNQKWRFGAGLAATTTYSDDLALKTEVSFTDSIYSSSDLVNLVPHRNRRLGGSAKIGIECHQYYVGAQYVTAFETVELLDEETETSSPSKPAGFNLELIRSHDFDSYSAFAVVGYSQTRELATIQPEHQILLTGGLEKNGFEVAIEVGSLWEYPSVREERSTAEFVAVKMTYSW